jgi:type II secretory pathway pseudopilin PulG
VIAIIAVLAALLLPTLARANEKAHRAFSLSNLRQWGLALNMYLDDANQTFPDFSIANNTPGAPSGYDQDNIHWTDLAAFAAGGYGNSAWFNALPPYVSQHALWQYAANPTNFVDGRSILKFKYRYVAHREGTKIGDPGNPDINWSYDGSLSQ